MNPEQNKSTAEVKKEEIQKTERVPIKSLRTFQGDVQEAISKNKYSSTTILVSEQKRQIERPEMADLKKKADVKNKSYLIIGSMLILLGIGAIYLLFTNIKKEETITQEERQKTYITYSEIKEISDVNLTKDSLVQAIQNAKETWNGVVNSVMYLNIGPVNNPSDLSEITETIGRNMPPSLSRSFGKEYMMGIYSFDTNETFIIISIDDYSLAYPGMLKWEENMANDLDGLFDLSKNGVLETNTFVDETVKNRDMRVLKDSTGKPLVLYSFIDRETLVITKNESILSAIVGKIVLNKQVR
ncbi:MAG TPA: hypothetical protein PLZ99_00050 [Parcubacteria group bacterium]|jgi:hypothetical protein|nr:hypothetical protein [Parcubacteria group bacterium]